MPRNSPRPGAQIKNRRGLLRADGAKCFSMQRYGCAPMRLPKPMPAGRSTMYFRLAGGAMIRVGGT